MTDLSDRKENCKRYRDGKVERRHCKAIDPEIRSRARLIGRFGSDEFLDSESNNSRKRRIGDDCQSGGTTTNVAAKNGDPCGAVCIFF